MGPNQQEQINLLILLYIAKLKQTQNNIKQILKK